LVGEVGNSGPYACVCLPLFIPLARALMHGAHCPLNEELPHRIHLSDSLLGGDYEVSLRFATGPGSIRVFSVGRLNPNAIPW